MASGADIAAIFAGGAGGVLNTVSNAYNYMLQKQLAKDDQKYALARMQSEQEFNAAQAALARDFSASEAQKQRDFEQMMSNSAYQRAIVDMKAAGINPASIAGGAAASTPQGASANVSSASSGASNVGSHGMRASDWNSSLISSAVNGLIAKDRDAAKFMADEIRDNARHAHKMEEIREWKAEKKAENSSDPNAGFEVL